MGSKVDVNAWRGVWVFVEQYKGKPARVSFELLGKGRELADKLGVSLTAIVLGSGVESLAKDAVASGADRVLLADDPKLAEYSTELYAKIIADAAVSEKPEILLVGASPVGRDLAPTLSYRLTGGCTADCTVLDADLEKRLLVSTRPAFGGNVMATIICPDHRPQMSTVRPGVMPLPEPDPARPGEIINLGVDLAAVTPKVRVLESRMREIEGGNLIEAEKVVGIGMGAGSKEGFDLVCEMARLMDAEVAGTRPAVEAGWISHDSQVGQTGKTIRPSLYIACGISGTVQHTAGMSGAKTIIAINKDPNAEIFKFADYGIVGDIAKVAPKIMERLKAEKG